MKAKQFYSSPAWKYCSRYMLLLYANDDYIVQCSTSGQYMPINSKGMHAGHYIKVFDGSKTNFSVALELENLAPQCHQDNIYSGGKPDIMKDWLIKKHGKVKIDTLMIKKHNICRLDKWQMQFYRDHYKKLFDDLVLIKGDPWKK